MGERGGEGDGPSRGTQVHLRFLFLWHFFLNNLPFFFFPFLLLYSHPKCSLIVMLQLSPLGTQVEKEQHDRLSRMANSQNEALANLNDYLEILQSEVYVDLDRLRLLARHGIPNELRAVCFYMSIRHRDTDTFLTGGLEISLGCSTSRPL